MEKSSIPSEAELPEWRKSGLARRSTWTTSIILVAAACISCWFAASQASNKREILAPLSSTEKPFRWSAIEPSTRLTYQDCHDGLHCARLEVPMDYENPNAPGVPNVVLAIIRRPARVPIVDSHYGGAIITNPGGPGGSGVAQQLSMGHYIQDIADAERDPGDALPEDKYFDIISFDPRGVNHTTPTMACFPDNASRERWNLQSESEGMLGSSANSLKTNWRRATALASGCSSLAMANETGPLAEHVNTTPVAVDIETIIEKHGEWREKETRGIISSSRYSRLPGFGAEIPPRLTWSRGSELLQYWGFSYGTLLGSTFASMYPDRIGRMVLDGNIDTDDYYSGLWYRNLLDTDKILDLFMSYCDQAGPNKCPFWREGGPTAINETYEELLATIWDDPVAVPGSDTRGPEIITWTDVKTLVKDAMYAPLHGFPAMATLMQDVTHGNGSLFADYKYKNRKDLCHTKEQCETPFSHECILPHWSPFDAMSAVLCTDGLDASASDMDDFNSYWQDLRNQSRAMGDYWAATRLTCAGWKGAAKNRFSGPFSANTSHPLLFIGNSYDTVTPFANAAKMSGQFPGSGLLKQNSAGHCSFTSPSVCTGKAVRRYFQHDALPDDGTVCEPDDVPLIGARPMPEEASWADRALLKTLRDASADFKVPS